MLSFSNLLCDQSAGSEALRYGHTARRATPRPVVVWALTRACNLRCVHCYASADAHPAPGELTFQEGLSLLDDLKAFEIPAVLFSGGEPLVHPRFLDLLDYANGIGLHCTLSTNGLLIDEAMADKLAAKNLKYVGISIDGAPDRHDKLRGMAGAWAASVRAIDLCRQRGIKVGVRFTVQALNRMELGQVIDLCLEHDVQRLCVYHLAYSGRGDHLRKVALTSEQTRGVVDELMVRTQEAQRAGKPLEVLTVGNHCDAAYLLLTLQQSDPQRAQVVAERLAGTGGNRSGCNIASIDSTGHVHYDQFSWHYSCGEIRQSPFSRIWTAASDPRLAILRDRKGHLPARCQSCRFVGMCNGNLRTRAEAATGDWLGDDPACYLSDAEIAAR